MSKMSALMQAWHKQLNMISGGMALAIGSRKASRSDLNDWAKTLAAVAKAMERVAKEGP